MMIVDSFHVKQSSVFNGIIKLAYSFYLIFIQLNSFIFLFLSSTLGDLYLNFLLFRIKFKAIFHSKHELLVSSIFIQVIIVVALIYFLIMKLKIHAILFIFSFFSYIQQLAVLFDQF